MWEIPWPVLLRMLYDLPNQKYKEKNEDESQDKDIKELSPQTSTDFAQYIQKINQQNKK